MGGRAQSGLFGQSGKERPSARFLVDRVGRVRVFSRPYFQCSFLLLLQHLLVDASMSVSEPTSLPNGIKSFIVDLTEAALPADAPQWGIPEVYNRACIGCSGPGQYWILLSDSPNNNNERTLRMLGPLDKADRIDLVQDFVLPKDTHLLPPSKSALPNFWLWVSTVTRCVVGPIVRIGEAEVASASFLQRDWNATKLLIPDLIRHGIIELHTKVLTHGIIELTYEVRHPKDRDMYAASLMLASSELAYLCFGCYSGKSLMKRYGSRDAVDVEHGPIVRKR